MVLSLHKLPFVTAHFQFITAHFVRHCALKNALAYSKRPLVLLLVNLLAILLAKSSMLTGMTLSVSLSSNDSLSILSSAKFVEVHTRPTIGRRAFLDAGARLMERRSMSPQQCTNSAHLQKRLKTLSNAVLL